MSIESKKHVAEHLTNKGNLIKLIIFTAIFALCFVNLYKPFSSATWYEVSPIKYFLFSCILVLTGILVISLSRYLMYLFVRRHKLYYLEYFLWILTEIVVLASLYTVYTLSVREFPTPLSIDIVADVFRESNINTFLIILLPYCVSWLYFSLEDKKHKLKDLEKEEYTINTKLEPSVIAFKNDRGELKFSVTFDNIIYLESADNYVIIKYQNKGKISEFMLRNTLKQLSEEIESTAIKRCHRSYMVNFEHITAIRTDKEGISLELDVDRLGDIPVSKTYNNEVTEAFLHYSGKK